MLSMPPDAELFTDEGWGYPLQTPVVYEMKDGVISYDPGCLRMKDGVIPYNLGCLRIKEGLSLSTPGVYG